MYWTGFHIHRDCLMLARAPDVAHVFLQATFAKDSPNGQVEQLLSSLNQSMSDSRARYAQQANQPCSAKHWLWVAPARIPCMLHHDLRTAHIATLYHGTIARMVYFHSSTAFLKHASRTHEHQTPAVVQPACQHIREGE